VIANGTVEAAIGRAITGEIGTRFLAGQDGLDARRRWLRAHLAGRGAIVVDDGAAAALRFKGRSLLPAGVVEAQGRFDRGDAVEVRDRRGHVVGFGLANYAAADVERLAGAHSSAIIALLGYHHGDEIVHRDNLVVLAPEGDEERAPH
jgi:glutamate 5-kinase